MFYAATRCSRPNSIGAFQLRTTINASKLQATQNTCHSVCSDQLLLRSSFEEVDFPGLCCTSAKDGRRSGHYKISACKWITCSLSPRLYIHFDPCPVLEILVVGFTSPDVLCTNAASMLPSSGHTTSAT